MGLNWTGLPGPDQLSTPCIRTVQGSRGSGRTLGVTTLCGGVFVSDREDRIMLFVALSDMGTALAHALRMFGRLMVREQVGLGECS